MFGPLERIGPKHMKHPKIDRTGHKTSTSALHENAERIYVFDFTQFRMETRRPLFLNCRLYVPPAILDGRSMERKSLPFPVAQVEALSE